jgi:aspartyl-tRNA(Asn)/glutamyl-tRNA(Gln) amidotransferase subunit A
VLASLGAEVVDVQLPYYTEVLAALGVIVSGEMLAYHLPDAQIRLPDFVASNRLGLGRHTFYTGADYVQAQRVRRVAHRALTALYDDVDLVLTPTAVVGALRLDDLGDDFATWFGRIHTPYWDAMGNPVISVPMGSTAAGLPLGLQLAGRAFDEATVLRAADAYQEVADWHLEQPPLTTTAVAA